MRVRLPFLVKKRVSGGIVSSLSGFVYNSSVLPLAFFERKKILKNAILVIVLPLAFFEKIKIKNDAVLSLFESLLESLLSLCKVYIYIYIYFFFFYLSHTRLFS